MIVTFHTRNIRVPLTKAIPLLPPPITAQTLAKHLFFGSSFFRNNVVTHT